MNHDEIMKLEDGELGFLVLRDAMGWQPVYTGNSTSNAPDDLDYWIDEKGAQRPCGFSPATEMDATWLVVENIVDDINLDLYTTVRGWRCDLDDFTNTFTGVAETAPRAICRAILALTPAPGSDTTKKDG